MTTSWERGRPARTRPGTASGLGILLVPLGALFLFIAVLLTARRVTALRKPASSKGPEAASPGPRRHEAR